MLKNKHLLNCRAKRLHKCLLSATLYDSQWQNISGNNTLTVLFRCAERSDLNSLVETSGVSCEWGWPAWSRMVSTLVLGSAWYLVLRQTGGWSSSKGLASSWHQLVIYRIKHSSHSYLPGKREQERFSCTHNKESLYPFKSLLENLMECIPHTDHLLITSEINNLCLITRKETFKNTVLNIWMIKSVSDENGMG